jgi:AraC-like DNA-binding protein
VPREATEAAVLDAMEAVLLDRVGPTGASVTLARRAVDRLADDPARSVAAVAGELGVSPGQLHRVVTQVVGLSPVAVRRIMRMRRLLEVADDPGVGGWTGLAARFGWYDQSHFTRDFRRHTGVTPSEYRRARIAHLPAEDRTRGFVPRP